MKPLSIYPARPSLAVEDAEPLHTDPLCELCSLSRKVRTPCMPPEVIGSGKAVFVHGQGPGESEDRQGRPNIGAGGTYLRGLLGRFWDGSVVFDNAVRCAPGATKVTEKMLASCRQYVASALLEAEPVRILCLGASAIASIVGRSFAPMSVRKGYTYTQDGVPVFFLMHPINALRNRFLRAYFEEDLQWALTANPQRAPSSGVYFMVETAEDAQDAALDMMSAETLAWDLETFGAPYNKGFEVLNLAITPQGTEYAYVLDKRSLDKPEVSGPVFKALLSRPSGGSNIKFDCIWLKAKYGIDVTNIAYDVQLWRKLLDADALQGHEVLQCFVGMCGGKDEVKPYIAEGVRAIRKLVKLRDQPVRKVAVEPSLFDIPSESLQLGVTRVSVGDDPKRYAYSAIPPLVRSRYNAVDAISTEKIRQHLEARLEDRPDIKNVWTSVTQPLNHAITCMEYNGIGVDVEVVHVLQSSLQAKIDAMLQKFAQFGEGFNPNSAQQVGDLLFGKLGLPSKGRTAKGQYSTTAEVLGNLKHPVAADLLAYRKASHFKAQYADGMASFIADDGRIHPSIKISGTATGRPSCEDPNLLNIPRAGTPEGKLCRDIFAAPVGYSILELDYSQIELRIAAMLSGDPIMIDLFKRGVDFHLETAKMIAPMFKVNPEAVTKKHVLRDHAKTTNFATLYGDPAVGLAAKLGISVPVATKLQEAILGRFTYLRSWINERLKYSRKLGVTRTWWDGRDFRERPLWGIADPNEQTRLTSERSSYNTAVQGTAADYTNASLGAIQTWLENDFVPAKLILTVYDSIMLEVRNDVLDEVVSVVSGIMTSWPVMHDVPIEVEAKVGHAWGSLEKI